MSEAYDLIGDYVQFETGATSFIGRLVGICEHPTYICEDLAGNRVVFAQHAVRNMKTQHGLFPGPPAETDPE